MVIAKFSKKYISIVSIISIFVMTISFSGCDKTDKFDNQDEMLKDVKLVYYTIGTQDKDIGIVADEINKKLKKKINLTIEYNKIAWADYGVKLSTIISSGGDFDIAFASNYGQGDYVGNAQKGAWLELDKYLINEGKEMYETINPLFWEGVRINKKIYGVPTNKEVAVPLHFMYPKSLVDKYDIDISKYKTIQSLQPLLEFIRINEPDYLPFELDQNAHNYFAIDGYEYLIQSEIPLMVKSTDKNLKIVNIFETEECKNTLNSIRKYYLNGYINKDAALKESGNLEANKKVFLRIAQGGPYADIIWSNDREYRVVTQQVSDLVVTTESTQGGVMVVNSQSKYPSESVKFLNCLNTDSEIRNLFNFGIEGKHYTLTKDDQVNKISNDYAGVQYTQGNWFNLKTVVGEPLDKWKQFGIFNNSAFKSNALGFTANITHNPKEIKAIKAVYDKYYPSLMTGSIDVATFLPRFVAELKIAGLDELRDEVQLQLDNWKYSH